MESRRWLLSTVLIFICLLLPAAATYFPASGGTRGGGSAESRLHEAVGEEEEAQLSTDLEIHRRILAGSNISPGAVYSANKPVCIGSCPARGAAYTGANCASAYQCRHG